MSYIENQAIFICIIYGFQGHRQFYHAQIRGKVTAGSGYPIDEEFPNLSAKLLALVLVQTNQILMTMNIL
jgi:hypothetical protein